MTKKLSLEETLRIVKDLLLFESAWSSKSKIKKLNKHTQEKIKIYRRLVKNGLQEPLNNIYANTKTILKNKWSELLLKYIETFPPDSPILNRVAEHFPTFLSKQKNILKQYPFIAELARYEWLGFHRQVECFGAD